MLPFIRKYTDLHRIISHSKANETLVPILLNDFTKFIGVESVILGIVNEGNTTYKYNIKSPHCDDKCVSEFITENLPTENFAIFKGENLVYPDKQIILIIKIADDYNFRGFILLDIDAEICNNLAKITLLGELGAEIGHTLSRIEDEKDKAIISAQLSKTKRLETVSILAGGIAHDFNNILTPILGYADLLQMDIDQKSKSAKYLSQIIHATERAKKLVNQVLIFSKQIEHDFHNIDFGKSLSETICLLKASLTEQVKLVFSQPDKTIRIFGNHSQLNQLLIHVYNNAIRALNKTDGYISITLSEIETNDALLKKHSSLNVGKYALLSICDNGTGMDKKTLERALDPFFTTRAVGEGTGMGLSIAYGIVSSHNGVIELESEQDIGTTVKIYFPIKRTQYLYESIEQSSKNGSILLVDDQSDVTFVLSEMLNRLGYNVSAFDSGEKALIEFREKKYAFDMIITDQVMPGMNGTELIEQILRIRPDIPSAIITGYGDLKTRKKGHSLGINALIMKPVVIKELDDIIQKALNSTKHKKPI